MIDRRRQPRLPSSGSVWIRETTPGKPELEAELLDVSLEGFRAGFPEPCLERGALVDFRTDHRRGIARVVWVRRIRNREEAGFHVTSEEPC